MEYFQNNSFKSRKISYDSKTSQIIKNGQSDKQYNETLSKLLKGFGIGKISNGNRFEIPLDYCFDELQIKAEWQMLTLERKWMHSHLLDKEVNSNN